MNIFLLYFLPVPLTWARRPIKPRRLAVVAGKAGVKGSRHQRPARKQPAASAPRGPRRGRRPAAKPGSA